MKSGRGLSVTVRRGDYRTVVWDQCIIVRCQPATCQNEEICEFFVYDERNCCAGRFGLFTSHMIIIGVDIIVY